MSVYRTSDADDYVEIDKLGDGCQLYFSNANSIDQRATGRVSDRFDCRAYGAQAYGRHVLVSDGGVAFDPASNSVRALTDEAVLADRDGIAKRQICVLKRELVDNPYVIDYAKIPADAVFSCISKDEYHTLHSTLSGR